MKEGYFTIPDDPAAIPNVVVSRCRDVRRALLPEADGVREVPVARASRPSRCQARGTLYSYTWVHMPLFGSMRIEHMDGYGVGQIDLPEGPRIQLPLAGKRDEYRSACRSCGEIEPLREDDGRDICILRFRPAGS